MLRYQVWGMGWSSTAIGDIMNDLGNTYFAGSGYGGGGIRSKCRRTVRDFSKRQIH